MSARASRINVDKSNRGGGMAEREDGKELIVLHSGLVCDNSPYWERTR